MKPRRQQIKLSQEVKRMSCNILDPHHRGAFIRTMFLAELEEHQYKNKRARGASDKTEPATQGDSND